MKLACIVAVIFLSTFSLGAENANGLKLEPLEFRSNGGEVVKAEAGVLTVPENRNSGSKRTIQLRFVKFPATAKNGKKVPIIYLAGGPGGSGIDAARGSRFPLFLALREFGDVIAFDQRGTGLSEPDMKCTEQFMAPFSEALSRTTAGAVLVEASAKCFERLKKSGIDIAAYNTRENAADLNDLRIALGAEKMTLWGISYGTHLALAAMKYHGEHIERVILAGVEPLNHLLKLPADQQRLLEKIADLSRKDPKVHAVVPDLLASIKSLLAKLEQQPQTVSLTHPLNGMTAELTVGKFDLQYALADMLVGPQTFAGLPDFVARLEKGDWTALALVAAQARIGNVPNAMSIAMDCASGADQEWKEKIAAQASVTLLGDAINFPFPEICQGLPESGKDFRAPVSSKIPALLISGTLDGRTPPENAEAVAAHLQNSQHLVIDGAGHSDPLFLSSPEILKAMQAFLKSEPIAKRNISIAPDPFVSPRIVVTLSDDVLDGYVGSYKITDTEVRRVLKAGNLLYTQRGQTSPRPIRPMSETEFFYEGSPTWLRFEKASIDKPAKGNYEFANGQWFDGKSFVNRTVYTVNGLLTFKKPERIEGRYDLTNKFVVPPFSEVHNHNVAESSRLDQTIRQYLDAGIFYVKNPNSLPRTTVNLAGKINVPQSIDVIFANGGLTATGGHPLGLVARNIERGIWTAKDGEGAFYFTIDNKTDLDQKWKAILEGKPDFIKTYLLYSEEYEKRRNEDSYKGWRGLDPALLPEIVARAHKAGLRVSTHVESATDFHNALVAGVDEVNHMPGSRPEKDDPAGYADVTRYEISDADAQLAADRKVVVVTTLGDVLEAIAQIEEGSPQAELAAQVRALFQRNLRKLHQHGALIAIGSDRYEGSSLNEIQNLQKLDVFDNATLLKMWSETSAKAIFPNRKIGHLQEGYEASFLVLNGDPVKNFANVQSISLRVKQGEILSSGDVSGMTVFQEGRTPGEYAPRADTSLQPSK